MNNSEKLQQAFNDGLRLPAGSYSDELKYESIREWDSTGHMALIVEIEKQFDVMLTMDDIIDMNSVGMAKTILGKYGVEF